MMDGFDIAELCRFSNNFKLELKNPPDFVYHYTSKEAAKNIIKGNTLRFTDRYFLNDYSEGKYIFELCKEHLKDFMPESRLRTSFEKKLNERIAHGQKNQFFVYQCSMTTDQDSLCMWNYYTNQDSIQGYNLKFNSAKIAAAIHPTTEIEDGKLPIYSGMVVYDLKEQLAILNTFFQNFLKFVAKYDPSDRHGPMIAGMMIDKLSDQGVFYKKSCFSIENEFRVAISTYVEDDKFLAIKEERKIVKKHGLDIPYVDIHFDKDALIGITLSPTLKLADERSEILKIAKDNGYSNVTADSVCASEIPVRF